jgi:excisionase family DNA binding protein
MKDKPEQPASGAGLTAEPEFDRPPRFAQRASVSLRTCSNWLRQGRIPYVRVGRIVLIPWREALEHLNRNYRVNARGE